jgi:hypothetical protein
VDSPLTEEAREVIYQLPRLSVLRAVIEGPTSLPTVALPNLTDLDVRYGYHLDWLQGFRGGTLERLTSVIFRCESEAIGDFLGAFKSVAITTSIPATLSTFTFHTSRPWRPNYRSLLPFTQLKELVIECSCEDGCSSTIDDDIIIDLARAMPKLETLQLGNAPCQIPTGVTVEGLAALAYYCIHLSALRVHFQVASLDPPAVPGVASGGEFAIPREDCALMDFEVGEIHVPEESTLMVALTLLRIFPRVDNIEYFDEGWRKVADAMYLSRRLADHSSKAH